MKKILFVLAVCLPMLLLASCEIPPEGGAPVTDITGVVKTAYVNTSGASRTLSGTVVPANAANTVIVWSVKNAGGTNAAISGNALTIPQEGTGTLVVTATIYDGRGDGEDYTKDFTIEVYNADKQFWAYDMTAVDDYYQLYAALVYEGDHCQIWVEKDNTNIDKATAQGIADCYDEQIYGTMIEAFGLDDFNGEHIMDIANEFAHQDNQSGKLTILFLDILDGYHPTNNPSYVEGYFDSTNFLNTNTAETSGYKTNQVDMIYMDTYPAVPGSPGSNITIAHETQHLANYIISEELDRDLMDIWIDEGLSAAAEWVFLNPNNTGANANNHPEMKMDWFNGNGYANMAGFIDVGNNFFVWGNRVTAARPWAVLDDYATVYLFFQWLRLQTDMSIYNRIITSMDSDYEAVVGAIWDWEDEEETTLLDLGGEYLDWEFLLEAWLAANYINAESGPYGYMNDTVLKAVKAPQPNTIAASVSLFPGEGVYSSNPVSAFTSAANIRYSYLSDSEIIDGFDEADTLITYNISVGNGFDLDETVVASDGSTTGFTASMGIGSRYIAAPFTGPYRVGAGDILRQNGRNNNFRVSRGAR